MPWCSDHSLHEYDVSSEKLAEIMADPVKVEKMKKRDAVRNAKLQELAKKAFT